jgi:hypothetical protein
MHYFKARIFAVGLILVSIGLIYFNWHQLLQEGRYSMKLAAFWSGRGNRRNLSPDISLAGRKAHHCQGKDHRTDSVWNWFGRRID